MGAARVVCGLIVQLGFALEMLLLLQKQRLACALAHVARGGGRRGRWTVVHVQAGGGQEDLGKRTLGQVQHLDNMLATSATQIRRLFYLPDDDAQCQKEKEAGEEYGKEHKEIDVQLILTKHHRAIARLRPRAGAQCNKETRRTQIVGMLRQRQHQPIPQTKQTQQRIALIECNMCAQILGVLILHHKAVPAMAAAVVQLRHIEAAAAAAAAAGAETHAKACAARARASLRREELLQCHVVVPGQGNVQRMFALRFGPPIVAIVQEDLVKARRLVRFDNKRIILRRHEHIQLALRHIDDDAYVHVHEPGLNHKEHCLAGLQRRRLRFALLCGSKGKQID